MCCFTLYRIKSIWCSLGTVLVVFKLIFNKIEHYDYDFKIILTGHKT